MSLGSFGIYNDRTLALSRTGETERRWDARQGERDYEFEGIKQQLEELERKRLHETAMFKLQSEWMSARDAAGYAHETGMVGAATDRDLSVLAQQNQNVLAQMQQQQASLMEQLQATQTWKTEERLGVQSFTEMMQRLGFGQQTSERLGSEAFTGRQAGLNRAYSTSERRGVEAFTGGQSALNRAYGTSEREGGQAFSMEVIKSNQAHELAMLDKSQSFATRSSRGNSANLWGLAEADKARAWQSSEAEKNRVYGSGESEKNRAASLGDSAASREMAAAEAALNRQFQSGMYERGAVDSQLGTGMLPYYGKDAYGDFFRADDAETLAALKGGRIPEQMREQMVRASDSRRRAMMRSLGGRRGMASGTIARSLTEDKLRRDDDAEKGAVRYAWQEGAKTKLEARKTNEALGRATPGAKKKDLERYRRALGQKAGFGGARSLGVYSR